VTHRPMDRDSLTETKKRAWSSCPVCSKDLGRKAYGSFCPYSNCPYCGAPLLFVWWQRVLATALAVVLAYGVPALLGIQGYTLLLVGTLFLFPAFTQGILIYCAILPSKYVRRDGAVTTLSHR
jgi:hypothetical protein